MVRPSPWKLATGGTAIVAIGLSIALTVSRFEIRHLEKEVEQRGKQISNLTADLSQARTNAKTLEASVDSLSGQILTLEAESRTRITAAEQKLAAAQRETAAANQRAGAILSYQPKGSSDCERLLDVDRQFQESLK